MKKPVTADELSRLESAWREATRVSEQAREARNDAVRRALDEGWTHAQISRATGLTRGRIGQIAQGIDDAQVPVR